MGDSFKEEFDRISRLTSAMDRIYLEETRKLINKGDITRSDYAFWRRYERIRDEGRVTQEDRKRYNEINRRIDSSLEKYPKSILKILIAQRNLLKNRKPKGNAVIWGFFPSESGDFDINLSKYEAGHYTDNPLFSLTELNHQVFPEGRLFIKTESSIGTLIFGKHIFKLYGKLRNVEINDKPFPIDRIVDCPEKEIEVANPLGYPINPYFMFIGDSCHDLCRERLVYVDERFYIVPEMFRTDFHHIIEYRANTFAVGNLIDKNRIKTEEHLKGLERRIKELEKIVQRD